MNARRRILALLAGAAMLSCAFTGCSAQKQDPVTITIWTYYNGEQLESFNAEVKNFNDAVGKEKGITVESYSQGSVNDLEANVMNAAEGKVGADPLPNISFSVGSGYLPVTHAASDMQAIENSGLELSPIVEEVLNVAVDTVNNNTLYTPHAFANGQDARKVLEYAMSDRDTADRETVEERLAEGQSLSAATADFLSDENFDNWYQETLARLTALEG